MGIKVFSSAKINFMLKVTGTDNRGYHMLDMVTASINIFDTIKLSLRNDRQINLLCKGIEKEKNTAYKAALLFQNNFGTCGFDIEIEKGIPLSAGLGGSSADAAGVLCALKHVFGAEDEKINLIAQNCGSDVPYMLCGGYARVRGTGNVVEPFTCQNSYDIAVAKFKGGVSSQASYKMYDEIYKNSFDNAAGCAENVIHALKNRDYSALRHCCANSLYTPSSRLLPEINETLALLNACGAVVSVMSGSGSSCAGVFKSAKEAENCAAALREKGMYARAAKTIGSGIIFK